MHLAWTDHAKQRWQQRFSGQPRPWLDVLALRSYAGPLDRFVYDRDGIRFVCHKTWIGVYVITVYPKKGQ